MNLFLHLIFYCLQVINFSLQRMIALAILFCCSLSYAQNFEVDSIQFEIDTFSISIPDTTTLFVSENTKIYIKKGTITKNLVEHINKEQIVYIEEFKNQELPIVENNLLLVIEKPEKPTLEKLSNEINMLEEQLQKVRFNYYPPLTVLSSFSSVKIATTNSFEIYPKAIINTKSIGNQLYSASYFYKNTYYYYINDCISYCISTLDIRSPSFIV